MSATPRYGSFPIGPTTQRLEHRPFEPDDAEAVFAFNGNPTVMRYTGEPMMKSVAEARQLIERYPDFETVGFGRWACVLKDEQKVIGFCGLKYLTDLDQVDIGYRLLPDYWGRGLATEACRACVQFGFQAIGLSSIIGLVMPQNIASIRVLEKSGLEFRRSIELDGETVQLFQIDRAAAPPCSSAHHSEG